MPGEPSQTPRAETRRLAAIMFTDIVGFSRQMGADEGRMLRLLDVHNRIVQQAVNAHHGSVIKTIGDAFLVDFPSVVHAVQCGQAIQQQLRIHNAEKEKADHIHVRIGIHLGDIVQRDGDVFGDGVNIASRLQTLAEPDTIYISDIVYRDVAKKLDLGTVVSLGKPKLKNIAERFAMYALLLVAPKGVRQTLQVQRLKISQRVRPVHWLSAAGLLFIVGTVVTVRYFPVLLSNLQSPAPSTQSLPLPDKPSIVVLPFTNMSNDPSQDYFSDGITEDITTDLSKISSLFVIARNSAFTYKGKAVKVQDVSREMGVQYVLEGSVRKADSQVRVTAQLIDATTGHHLWAERYDRPLKDIFALQDEIVQKIVTTLKLQLTLTEQGFIVRKTTDNLEAYDFFLRGIEPFFRYTPETNAQARQLWEKAVAADAQYAEAYAWLSWTYWREAGFRWSADPQVLERALTLAQQALALDDSLPRAHSVLGFVYVLKQQYEEAIAESERATTLDPNNADLYIMRASVLNFAGRPEAALKIVEQALRLNPRYPPNYLWVLGVAYNGSGRYTEAVATLQEFSRRVPGHLGGPFSLVFSYLGQWYSQKNSDAQTLEQALEAAQRVIALNETYPGGHAGLGFVYLAQKQYESAIAEMERAIALNPNDALGYAYLAETLGHIGKSKEAVEMVKQALRRNPSRNQYLNIGVAYYLAGRPEEAITALKQFSTHHRNMLGGHLVLAAVYSEVGREAEARAAAAEVLRINPKWSLEVWKQRVPYKDPATLERVLAALRKAGLK